MADAALTVRDLRRFWKPHKERLNGLAAEHPTNVRFHRACSWLQRAEQLGTPADLDLRLPSLWTAFNALYGQWDQGKREPLADRQSWQVFLERMLELDQSQRIINTLQTHKRLVLAILEDAYLSRHYWQDPGEQQAARSKRTRFNAQAWYVQGDWPILLERLVERIYLMRCQLVHGAATYNSSLNRTAVRHCVQMMDHLLRSFLMVWIEYGAEEDWGIMCYPPIKSAQRAR